MKYLFVLLVMVGGMWGQAGGDPGSGGGGVAAPVCRIYLAPDGCNTCTDCGPGTFAGCTAMYCAPKNQLIDIVWPIEPLPSSFRAVERIEVTAESVTFCPHLPIPKELQ